MRNLVIFKTLAITHIMLIEKLFYRRPQILRRWAKIIRNWANLMNLQAAYWNEKPSPAETVKEQSEQSSIQKKDTVQTGQAIECNDRGQPEEKVLITEKEVTREKTGLVWSCTSHLNRRLK